MSSKIAPEKDQLNDLAVLRDLNPECIDVIIKQLDDVCDLIRPSDLSQVIRQAIPEMEKSSKVLVKLMISLNTLRRQQGLTTNELLEGISKGIDSEESGWTNEEILRWKSRLPEIEKLLFLPSVQTVVKGLDLSYDYANLYQGAKILTDIRPIFDETDCKIEGSVISFILRLYYDGYDGSKNISVALDIDDINKLIDNCKRAIKKAEISKIFMQKNDISKTIISGENEAQ